MKLIHDAGYLVALAVLLAAALFAFAGPPPVPTSTRPPAVPKAIPQAPPVAARATYGPTFRRYQWTQHDSFPGQLNLKLNGVPIGAYRIADGVYLEYQGGRWATEASPPPVAVPAAYRAKGGPAVPFGQATPAQRVPGPSTGSARTIPTIPIRTFAAGAGRVGGTNCSA